MVVTLNLLAGAGKKNLVDVSKDGQSVIGKTWWPTFPSKCDHLITLLKKRARKNKNAFLDEQSKSIALYKVLDGIKLENGNELRATAVIPLGVEV